MESDRIIVSQVAQQSEFPADFQPVAAMNSCLCGYFDDHSNHCHCFHGQIKHYRAKIFGPLLDRIDRHIDVINMPAEILLGHEGISPVVQQRVSKAFKQQILQAGKANNKLTSKEI